jgi:hypothetical protein
MYAAIVIAYQFKSGGGVKGQWVATAAILTYVNVQHKLRSLRLSTTKLIFL